MSGDLRPDWIPESAWFLEEHAEELMREVERLTRRIEQAEADLVRMRDDRATAARRAAEMRVAANVVRASGLRSESRPEGPYVELPNPPRDPVAA